MAVGETQTLGNAQQALIARPKTRSSGELRGRQQMRVNVAEPKPREVMPLDKMQGFVVHGDDVSIRITRLQSVCGRAL